MTSTQDHIAVIGMSCRFSGDAHNPEQLWKMLAEGRDAWSDVPADRYNWRAFHHPDPNAMGGHNHRGGHFLQQDVNRFDARFFGIPPTEATSMDPQQSLLLEIAYETFEDAGITLEQLDGSNTGVYVAKFAHDFETMAGKDQLQQPKYLMIGIGGAILSNRISHVFNLKGSSLTVDTACSGSLVALHQACQSLRTKESETVLVGGTNLILSPDMMMPMSKLGFLSDDGRCYSFDSRGSGYGRGEGIAMVALKRLEDAIRDGDNVRAVIRGTGVNQDGRTPGITLPSGQAQKDLIRSVYQTAGLNPRDTSYVEAHGTGTVAGDATEVGSLIDVFDPPTSSPLVIGSIKANVGHTESSSGLAGLIKVVLALEKGYIPPNPNLVDIKESLLNFSNKMSIPRTLQQWPEGKVPRASINSFGYGGTNAHAIVEKLTRPASDALPSRAANSGEQLFVVTAKTERSVVDMCQKLSDWISGQADSDRLASDLSYTLSQRRSTMPWRHTFTAASKAEIVSSCTKLCKPIKSSHNTQVVFVFTGQGAQWSAMGRELLASSDVFRESMALSDEILRDLGCSWSLLEELARDKTTTRIDQSELGQPATTAIQIALVQHLRSLNVMPVAVVGHSSGEVAASFAVGALDHRAAIKVAFYRGFLAKRSEQVLGTKGGMLAVGLGEEEVTPYLEQVKSGKLVVACVNSPQSTTISGDATGISELQTMLEASSIFARKLKVETAYHSFYQEVVADSYLAEIDELHSKPPKDVKFFSSVTGTKLTHDFAGKVYWAENLISKVRFSDAVSRLCDEVLKDQHVTTAFIEIGPHSALAGPFKQIKGSLNLSNPAQIQYLPTLIRNQSASSSTLQTIGTLFSLGCEVDLLRANSPDGRPGRFIQGLPSYAWDHSTSYKYETRLTRENLFRQQPYHDLLGARFPGANPDEPAWRHLMSAERMPWLQDHVVDGQPVFPAAGYIAMAIEAKRQMVQNDFKTSSVLGYVVKDMLFTSPLVISGQSDSVETWLTFKSTNNKGKGSPWNAFRVCSVDSDGTWREHCTGLVKVNLAAQHDLFEPNAGRHLPPTTFRDLQKLLPTDVRHLRSGDIYDEMRAMGNEYGPAFSGITEMDVGRLKACGTIAIQDIAAKMPAGFANSHVIHPGTLDAIIHSCLPIYSQISNIGSVYTAAVGELEISTSLPTAPGSKLHFATDIRPEGAAHCEVNSSVFHTNAAGDSEVVLRFIKGELRGVSSLESGTSHPHRDSGISFDIQWARDVDISDLPKGTAGAIDANEPVSREDMKANDLNTAACLFIDRCLRNVGVDEVEPSQVQYFKWMQRIQKTQQYRDATSKYTDFDEFQSKLELAGVEGEALCRVGVDLEKILTGSADSLALLFNDDFLYRAYSDDSSSKCYAHLVNFMKELTFKNPNLAVLEIGGGTAGATLPLLKGLSTDGNLRMSHYDFTDISSGFFANARDLLGDWDSVVNYKVLDIGRDPFTQGFTGNYDVVIASNAIHVTNFVDEAIENARKLLKPGGWLLLVESTINVTYVNLLVGILPTWYCGVEDGRTDSPIMSVEEWDTRLRRNSFNGIELAQHDFPGSAHKMSFLASRHRLQGPDFDGQIRVVTSPKLSNELSNFSKTLTAQFSSKGVTAVLDAFPTTECVESEILILIDDPDNSVLSNEPSDFKGALNVLSSARNVLWISLTTAATKSPSVGLATGLARTARLENENLKLVTLDATSHGSAASNLQDKIWKIIRQSFLVPTPEQSNELEYAYDNGEVSIPRLLQKADLDGFLSQATESTEYEQGLFHQSRPLKLKVGTTGLLDSLHFVHNSELEGRIAADEIELRVFACGVNFKDILVALGQIKPSARMTGECAGVVTKVGSNFADKYKVGDRVLGWCGTVYANIARIHGFNAHHFPEDMSFNVAASIPITFITAYYGLVELAHLKRGQTVLIHAAAGGVGQAALQIATHIGATVFATVGSEAKTQFLIDQFGIPRERIFSSRTTTFKKSLLSLTADKGVDVVLNSLSGEMLQDSWACVSQFGTFVEIGKTDIQSKNSISLEPFDKNITFASVDLAAMSDLRPETNVRRISAIMEGFAAGIYRPIDPVKTLPINEIESAFRLLQSGRHTGKVVLSAEEGDMVKVSRETAPKLQLKPNATYLVAGGTSGLGLEVGRFLARHGASDVLLLSRRKMPDTERQSLADDFADLGAKLHVVSCDITKLGQCIALAAQTGQKWPPIRGIVQSAMVLKAKLIAQMDIEDFESAVMPKALGNQNLDKAFQSPDLDFFVSLSSLVGLIGDVGSSNYGAASAYQDAFTHRRSGSHTRYVSINLGAMRETGFLARESKVEKAILAQGLIPLDNADLFSLLEYSLSQDTADRDCRQIVVGFNRESLVASSSPFLKNPMLRLLPSVDENSKVNDRKGDAAGDDDLAKLGTMSRTEAQALIASKMAEKISTLVVVDREQISSGTPLADLGIDSLIGIELKNWISRSFSASIQTSDIFGANDIHALAALVVGKSALSCNNPEDHSLTKATKAVSEADSSPPSRSDTSLSEKLTKRPQDERRDSQQDVSEPTSPPVARTTLPKQPVPNLADTLQHFTDFAEAMTTGEELEILRSDIEHFGQAGGAGTSLQEKLLTLSDHVDNWYAEKCLSHAWLQTRTRLGNYFGAHPPDNLNVTVADRAALTTLAAFKCREMIESDQIDDKYLVERALDQDSYRWLFNSCRQPGSMEDCMQRYPGYDHIVAFRRGKAFKISLRDSSGGIVGYSALRNTFDAIMNTEGQSFIGILTADQRPQWTEYRNSLQALSQVNKTSLYAIESAAFVVCLDEGSPSTPSERAFQFFQGHAINRWYDKTLQFIICENGSSATICEHAQLDGTSTLPLADFISEITESQDADKLNSCDISVVPFEELPFTTDARHLARIAEIERLLGEEVPKYSFSTFTTNTVNNEFFRQQRCPSKSTVQLVIQLACFRFFGYHPVTAQTVSMAMFSDGRVATAHTVHKQVVRFCDALSQAKKTGTNVSQCLPLFYEAVNALAKGVALVAEGLSVSQHLFGLQWICEDECDPKPDLFNNPTLQKFNHVQVIVDCLEHDMQECAGPQVGTGDVLIHFQAYDDRVLFCTWGNDADAPQIGKCIEDAARDVAMMLRTGLRN